MSRIKADAADHLPLKPDVFQILLALEGGDMHGYAMLKEIEGATHGRMRLAPSPFYRKLKRLEEDGLVDEADERPASEVDDERRRYYRLSELGREVLSAEAMRLVELAGRARIMRLAGAAMRDV
ncbi:MAG TPA: PadR family transcriptional regulator [Longimicrobiales bacterium]|jgi:DNA-binding PadR family transcriptional regulator